jgi:hypothetical protein
MRRAVHFYFRLEFFMLWLGFLFLYRTSVRCRAS